MKGGGYSTHHSHQQASPSVFIHTLKRILPAADERGSNRLTEWLPTQWNQTQKSGFLNHALTQSSFQAVILIPRVQTTQQGQREDEDITNKRTLNHFGAAGLPFPHLYPIITAGSIYKSHKFSLPHRESQSYRGISGTEEFQTSLVCTCAALSQTLQLLFFALFRLSLCSTQVTGRPHCTVEFAASSRTPGNYAHLLISDS